MAGETNTQGSMQPHIDYMRSLASRFSGETNVPLSELGVVSDNPTSAEAIYAAKEALVVEAQNLNADNGEALAHVALMALAIKEGTTYAAQAARRLRSDRDRATSRALVAAATSGTGIDLPTPNPAAAALLGGTR